MYFTLLHVHVITCDLWGIAVPSGKQTRLRYVSAQVVGEALEPFLGLTDITHLVWN